MNNLLWCLLWSARSWLQLLSYYSVELSVCEALAMEQCFWGWWSY